MNRLRLPLRRPASLALALSGCSTLRSALPFVPRRRTRARRPRPPKASASPSSRSTRASSRRGPEGRASSRSRRRSAVAAWPLPGGTPEQSVEHVEAAPAFEIAWRRAHRPGLRARPDRSPRRRSRPTAGSSPWTPTSTVSAHRRRRPASQAWRVDLRPRAARDRSPSAAASPTPTAGSTSPPATASSPRSTPRTARVVWRTPTDAPIHGAPTVSRRPRVRGLHRRTRC